MWPAQRDLELMTSVSIGIAALFHGVLCMPYSTFLSKDMPSPREMLRLPPPGSHPVFIARKLLMLGAFLQSIPPGAVEDVRGLRIKKRETMVRVVETASRLVTTNDDLIVSVEGVECIMIESMYQNNAGKLRHAWLTNRRAMMTAQTMGIHLGNLSLSHMLDLKTQERIDPEYMWLRLVTTDRYLSLMLGLPQGSVENPFATPNALEGCTPLERMERIEVVVGGRILQRNTEDLHNLEATHEIDKLLQNAANSMPAQWWLIPDAATIAGLDANAFSETIRSINQFTHYHLLAQLHLPYMLQSSADRKYDYSKITAVNASREILSRFVHFLGSNTVPIYCRGVDFLAFIASTTLCLAHIDVRRKYGKHMTGYTTVFDFLVHQRLADRGLMERTLQTMEKMAQIENDVIASKITGILRRLLAIEAAAANDGCYNARFSFKQGEQESLCGDNGSNGDGTLCITIPHLGTIKIEHGGAVRYVEVAHKSCEENAQPDSISKASHSSIGFSFESKSVPGRVGHQSTRKVSPSASSPAGRQTGDKSVHAGSQNVSSHLNFSGPAEEYPARASDQDFFELNDDPLGAEGPLLPGLAADVDDWVLQGVDTTLFDSLLEGRNS